MSKLNIILKMSAMVWALGSAGPVWSQPVPWGAAASGAPGAVGAPGAAARPAPGGPAAAPFIKIERDIEYAVVGNRALHLDLYSLGAGDKKPQPVVLWVHGDAPPGTDKSPTPAARLVANGYVVASIEYRPPSEASFPTPLHDLKAAVRWLRAHATTYNLDADHIGAWGESEGGHLAAMLGTTGDVKELEGTEGNLDRSSRIHAVVDFSGPIDSTSMGGSTDKVKAANPITYISKDDPPFLIVHGTADQVVPPAQSGLLQVALKHAGVENTLEYVPGAGHHIKQVETPAIADAVTHFFDKNLRENQHSRTDLSTIRVPPDSWIDPFSDDMPGTQYKLFATATRGPNTQASYRIYFPPGYDLPENAERRYPVIYYLHGFGNDSRSAVVSGYIPRLDAAIRMGYMPPTIVVAVQVLNDSKILNESLNEGKNPVDLYIVKDLIPHIDKTYRTVATRDGRAIEGHSLGGDRSLRLGFRYVNMFGSVAAIAPALGVPVNAPPEVINPGTPPVTTLPSRIDDAWASIESNAEQMRGRTFVRFLCGDHDSLRLRLDFMSEMLTRLKIEHSSTISVGATHDIREVLARLDENPFAYYGKAFAKFK